MQKQRILIIGSGGREHAIGWKIKQSIRAEHFSRPEMGVQVESA